MVKNKIKVLSDDQTEAFDTEYVSPKLRQIYDKHMMERFDKNEQFRVLDIGGGNGVFADSLLDLYPNCNVDLLDYSEQLISRNSKHPRKKLIVASVEEISNHNDLEEYDLICMHWVLHHFVCDSYQETTHMLTRVLKMCRGRLKPGGRISIFENMYDGMLLDSLPSHLIYRLTSAKSIAGLTRKFGANTAGIGVCFRSRKSWYKLIMSCDYKEVAYSDSEAWKFNVLYRLVLHLGYVRIGHMWLEA